MNLKKTKKIISFGIVATMIAGVFSPLSIFAEGSMTFNFNVDNNSNLALSTDGKHLVVSDGERNSYVDFKKGDGQTDVENDKITVTCSNDKTCTAILVDQTEVKMNYDFSFNDLVWGSNMNVYDEYTSFTNNENFIVREASNHFDNHFDGKVYLIWSCGSGICYHYFDNMEVDNHGVFIKESDVTADNKANTTFDVHADYKSFALKQNFEDWQEAYKTYKGISTIDWTKVDPEDCIGGPIDMREYEEEAVSKNVCTKEVDIDTFRNCVDNYAITKGVFTSRAQLQPVGEPMLNNAYVSYGDRNFKVIIYNNDYRALSIGDLNSLTYYPNTYTNELTRQDSFDISDTDEFSYTDIDMVLLEDTINLKALNYNGFELTSIEALEVPTGAINVKKNSDGTFTIKFNSNFFDEVVFKAIDKDGNEYYFRIVRSAIYAASVDLARGRGISVPYFYFDRNTSVDDYKLTARIEYTDGSAKIVELVNAKHIDDGLGNFSTELEEDLENPTRNEWPKGKGLKVASFKYDLNEDDLKDVITIHVNAEYKGSTATNYAGAFTGSGEGVYIPIERGM